MARVTFTSYSAPWQAFLSALLLVTPIVRTIEGAIDWINGNQRRRNVIRFFRTCIINWLITNGTNKEDAL